MIKVAVEISSLFGQSGSRGVGIYTKRLLEALGDRKEVQVLEFRDGRVPLEADLLHYPYFFPFSLHLPSKTSIKFVVTVHDLIPLVFPEAYPPGIKGRLRYLIQKSRLGNASRIITDSLCSKKDVIKFIGFPPEKIDVVFLAPGNKVKKVVDETALTKLARKFSLPKDFVLYVGDVNYNKNLPGLVRACFKLKVSLVLAGKQLAQVDFDPNNIENRALLELNRLIENKSNIVKVGFVEENDLAGIYSLAKVYCQPSFYEGFGLQVLEAMTCGCPVVTSNVSSLSEISQEAAVLVNPYNIDEIARGIERLMQNQSFKNKMIKAGFERVKEFSWNKVAVETVKTYEKILERKF